MQLGTVVGSAGAWSGKLLLKGKQVVVTEFVCVRARVCAFRVCVCGVRVARGASQEHTKL